MKDLGDCDLRQIYVLLDDLSWNAHMESAINSTFARDTTMKVFFNEGTVEEVAGN